MYGRFIGMYCGALIALGLIAGPQTVHAFSLTTGTGDGTVDVEVDGFGSFGSDINGTGTGDAVYDPVGAEAPSGTAYQSAIAIRLFGNNDRQYLSSGPIGGSMSNPTITGNSTTADSSFTYGPLSFQLNQQVVDLVDSTGSQVGSELQQTYQITNTSSQSQSFEVVRYLDGDLEFDGSFNSDGGGLLNTDGNQVLFETDSDTGSADETTFVGITGQGGITPATGRYEVDNFPDLRDTVDNGAALDDTISGDGADADNFIDSGNGYDVSMAMMNVFDIDGGQTSEYTTRTIFGTGAPEQTPGSLEIFKYFDANENGVHDEGEQPLENWIFDVTGPDGFSDQYTTDSNGEVFISGLTPGDYTADEQLMPGWTVTTNDPQVGVVDPGGVTRLQFGNVPEPTTLALCAAGGLMVLRRRRTA